MPPRVRDGIVPVLVVGGTLNRVLISLAAFNAVQGLAVAVHHARISPLRRHGFFKPRKAAII